MVKRQVNDPKPKSNTKKRAEQIKRALFAFVAILIILSFILSDLILR